jgi:hypothetical protein
MFTTSPAPSAAASAAGSGVHTSSQIVSAVPTPQISTTSGEPPSPKYRQSPLAVHGFHPTVTAQRRGVEEGPVTAFDEPDDGRAPCTSRGYPREHLDTIVDEVTTCEKVLGRVARDSEFRYEYKVRTLRGGGPDGIDDAVGVAREITDGHIDLRERDAHVCLLLVVGQAYHGAHARPPAGVRRPMSNSMRRGAPETRARFREDSV